jgi:hypothetical protein
MLYFATTKAIGPVLTHVELDSFYITNSVKGAIESCMNKKKERPNMTLNVYEVRPRVEYQSSVRKLEPTKALQVLHKQFKVDCSANIMYVNRVVIGHDSYGSRQKLALNKKSKPTFAAHQYLSVFDRVQLVGKISHMVAVYSLKERLRQIESDGSIDTVLGKVINLDLTRTEPIAVFSAMVYITHGYFNAELKDMLRMVETRLDESELERHINLGTLEYLYNAIDEIYWPEMDYVINSVTMASDSIASLYHEKSLRDKLKETAFPETSSFGQPVTR